MRLLMKVPRNVLLFLMALRPDSLQLLSNWLTRCSGVLISQLLENSPTFVTNRKCVTL
jgi:hypothetical protein